VSEAHKAALDAEVAAKEQLAATLDECRQQMKREQSALVTQVGFVVLLKQRAHFEFHIFFNVVGNLRKAH
jgi:hypothetical protein